MSLEINAPLSKEEAGQLKELETLSEDQLAERMWHENQERANRRYIESKEQTEKMNDLNVVFDCHGNLQTGTVTADSMVTLEKSGFNARAGDLVSAGIIPPSAIGMPFDQFIKEHG